ncbi:pilin [Microbulbifer sp. TRSA002]|uniref:pilin n=1 Tax=Microbulbifer sp. TRSA002 TaxID=3243382 RepID=UPI0040396574
MKKQQGFTLIELMIVVAIIGILAAVALPAYQDYTIRSKMSEVMLQAGAHRNSVTEYYQSMNTLPTTMDAAGVAASVPSPYITNVSLGANSELIYDLTIDGQSGKLQLAPTIKDGSLTWVCSATTISKKYLPANCR